MLQLKSFGFRYFRFEKFRSFKFNDSTNHVLKICRQNLEMCLNVEQDYKKLFLQMFGQFIAELYRTRYILDNILYINT